MIGAIFFADRIQPSAGQWLRAETRGGPSEPLTHDDFYLYQLEVFCDHPRSATAIFTTKGSGVMGTKVICAGNCTGGKVTLAEALAGLPAAVSTTFRTDVAKHDANAAAGKGRSLACLRDGKEPPLKKPCKNPPSVTDFPDWYYSLTRDCDPHMSAVVVTGEAYRALPPDQILCVAKLSFCETPIAKTQIGVSKMVTIDPAAWESDRATDWLVPALAACQSFFNEQTANRPTDGICCSTWEKALKDRPTETGCYPNLDADCDGLTNDKDPFPLHPRSTEYTSNSPLTNFPFWKDFKNATPGESCECQWELIDVRYKCANVSVQNSGRRGRSNQAKYDYQVKWKCPTTGREIVTNRQVTMPGLYCPRGRPNN